MSDIITTTEQPQSPRPPKRHRVRTVVLWISGLGIALIALISAIGGATGSGSTASSGSAPASSAPAAPASEAPPASSAPAAPAPTVAQEQALESAQSYLDMGGFSKAGLIEQLTSHAGEGFSHADAVWAVRHAHPDWNAQAVESAKSYLDMGGFSRASLIEQLSSSAGEGFTLAQATYAADQVGLTASHTSAQAAEPAPVGQLHEVKPGVYASSATSDQFAENVVAAWDGTPGVKTVYSPATGRSYAMTYTPSGAVTIATGGNGAYVKF